MIDLESPIFEFRANYVKLDKNDFGRDHCARVARNIYCIKYLSFSQSWGEESELLGKNNPHFEMSTNEVYLKASGNHWASIY